MSTMAIPREILQQHVAILGKTRSGKSSVMRGLVEDLLKRRLPVCIVDPKGDWWGVKLAADGKRPGYPVVIFGGEHADVPITEHAGGHVAELFATGNRPCLIDLGGWTVGARTRFWVEFASTLFKHTKGQRWLAVDEIHNFAPKGKTYDAEAGKALHWTNRLASEGLGKGVALLFASQRPQKVHNDTLTSAETLIAMRVLHPSDRGAVSDWIKGCGDSEGSEVLNSLAQMERGEGWVWSPEIGFGPKRVKFPLFQTYDSFRPQTLEDTKRLKGWAEVDLEEVRARLASVVEQAKADDPRELRKQVAELKRQLAEQQRSGNRNTDVPQVIEKPVLKDGQLARAEKLIERYEAATEKHAEVFDVFARTVVQPLEAVIKDIAGAIRQTHAPTPTRATDQRPSPHARRVAPALPQATGSSPARVVSPSSANGLSGPEQRILDAIAWMESIGVREPEQTAVAFLAGYTVDGGAYKNPRGSLSVKGLIAYERGRLVLMDEGRARAQYPEVALTPAELQRRVIDRLPGPERRLLEVLLSNYPTPISNEQLAKEAGYTAEGGAYKNPRGRLRKLGLIDYERGQVVAKPLLFLK